MEEMKWFSSAMLGVLAARNLGFLAGLWLKSAKPLTLASSSANEACHVQNQPHRASLTL
jgi:hypothetical protein